MVSDFYQLTHPLTSESQISSLRFQTCLSRVLCSLEASLFACCIICFLSCSWILMRLPARFVFWSWRGRFMMFFLGRLAFCWSYFSGEPICSLVRCFWVLLLPGQSVYHLSLGKFLLFSEFLRVREFKLGPVWISLLDLWLASWGNPWKSWLNKQKFLQTWNLSFTRKEATIWSSTSGKYSALFLVSEMAYQAFRICQETNWFVLSFPRNWC